MQYQWKIAPEVSKASVSSLAQKINVNPFAAKLLVQRGVDTFEKAKTYFRPSLEALHDPFLMKGMNEAVNLLTTAISNKSKIMIYGDYDVDGTTSVALAFGFLRQFSPQLITYIPDRYSEGYGVSQKGVNTAINTGVDLFVSLDCGVRANAAIAQLKEASIDVIVCDHHLPGSELPEATILNPKQEDCGYPFKELCGVGVGFKLLHAFCRHNKIAEEKLFEHLDLVAIGTSADIVPIVDENRTLIKYGLNIINKRPRPGIQAILGLSNFTGKMTVSNIVFTIGPRINAVGRIAHALGAVELLLEQDLKAAEQQALQIEQYNKERRGYDTEMTQEALALIKASETLQNAATTVLFEPHWHKGVVGIVASRCIEHYYRPTIILTQNEDGLVSGSARSVDGFDVHEAIGKCALLLEQYGGHKAAAGLTLKPENVERFQVMFEEIVAKSIINQNLTPTLEICMELPLERVTRKFMELLEQMEPFGPENMSPVFVSKNVVDTGASKCVGAEDAHLKLDIAQGTFTATGIAFKMGDYLQKIQQGEPFDVCYVIERNEFRNMITPQLMIRDIKFSSDDLC